VAGTGNEDPLAIFSGNDGSFAQIFGLVAFFAVMLWLYKRTQTIANRDVVVKR